MDNRGKARANTCKEGSERNAYIRYKANEKVNHNIRADRKSGSDITGDKPIKFLPYQLDVSVVD